MDGRFFASAGFGLVVSGGVVCWMAWQSSDHLALLAGAFGVGLGAAMFYRGQGAL